MTLDMNADFANHELSIEELEAIAAGSWYGNVWNFVKNEVHAGVQWAESPSGKSTLAAGGGALLNWALHEIF